MPRLTTRDFVIVASFVGVAAIVVVLALLSHTGWALSVLAGLTGAIGVASRLEFAASRRDRRTQAQNAHAARKFMAKIARGQADLRKQIPAPTLDFDALRSEIRGMRVSQQLLSQSVHSTKADLRASDGSITDLRYRIDALDDAIRAMHADLIERMKA